MSDESFYRYIDAKFNDQDRFIKTLVAPIVGDIVELKLGLLGDGNGRKSLRELLRTHTHTGMVTLNLKVIATVAAISASVATVAAAAFSILHG